MDRHLFRGSRWVIDLTDVDADRHLQATGFTQNTQLIMKYFVFLLYADLSDVNANEFSERHDEIKHAIIDVMRRNFKSAAREFSSVIEGIVKTSLIADTCIDSSKPHLKWTGTFHDHPEAKNFYQLLEGALTDPRSRIGRVIDYPPSEEIFHVSEMIRNPLAHGVASGGTLEDYNVLFFLVILLYHDIVNPHQYAGNHKYLKWAERTSVNLRLDGEEPTNERIEKLAVEAGLDVDELRKNLK